MSELNKVTLLVNGAHGQYVPQVFVEQYDLSPLETGWVNVDPENVKILREGPEHQEYWNAWEAVCDTARFYDGEREFTLYQDGDLWALCLAELTDDELWEMFP